jgi:hypothetical protein
VAAKLGTEGGIAAFSAAFRAAKISVVIRLLAAPNSLIGAQNFIVPQSNEFAVQAFEIASHSARQFGSFGGKDAIFVVFRAQVSGSTMPASCA